VLAAQEHSLEIDVHGQVPDLFLGGHSVVVLGVGDAGVVEQHVEPAEARLGGAADFETSA
jgi:hypothetical protein